MIDLLDTLHRCAVDLRRVGMMQSAGDYDYLVAWLKSPEFNNGEHLKPHPAGENTIDEYSNNCPIPFTPSNSIVKCCTDRDIAEQLIQSAKDIITELSGIYTEDIEQIAINEYSDYSDKIIALLGSEVPVPTPPDPPDPPEPPVDPPAESFGEIIKAYLTTSGSADTNNSVITTSEKPLYDTNGAPLLCEDGYQYTASNTDAGLGGLNPSALGYGVNGIDGAIYCDLVAGTQITARSLRSGVLANMVFLFRAKESFYILFSSGDSGVGTSHAPASIPSGGVRALNPFGTSGGVSYSKLSGLQFRDVIDASGNRLGTFSFSIEDSTNGAVLRNNHAESVTVSRVIFSD